jgi:hypothetical protein
MVPLESIELTRVEDTTAWRLANHAQAPRRAFDPAL